MLLQLSPRAGWLSLTCGMLLAGTVSGQLGFRHLTTTHPAAVQRGTTSAVRLKSNFTLDETYRVLFDRGNLQMTYLETQPIEAPLGGRTSPGTPFRFQVTVPADAEPGLYEYRVATKQAVSSVAQLLVTDYPVVEEMPRDNGVATKAQEIVWPAAICGTCEPAEDVDYYRLTAKAGEVLSFQIFAQRITDKLHCMVVKGPRIYLMDPILTLYGPDGRQVAQNDNYFGGDSCFTCRIPADGSYVLEVRDKRYAGDPRYPYCVEVGTRPVLSGTFPLAVQQGQTCTAELIGEGLEPAPQVQLTGSPGTLGWQAKSWETPRGQSNRIPAKTSDLAQILETEPNNELAGAQRVTAPVGINGRLGEPDDVDHFSFHASKGATFKIEVESARVGLPVDSVLEVFDSQGKLIAEADDTTQWMTKDSRLFWTAPADGDYTVAIRDLHGRGGARFVYHLSLEPTGPDFDLFGEYYYAMLAPGTRMMWFARVERRPGCEGPIQIEVDNLPPGVTAVPATIPAGMNHCAVILEAAPTAAIDARLVQVRGRTVVPVPGRPGETREVVRTGFVTCEQQSSGGGQARWPIRTQIVGVTRELDLLRVVAEPTEVRLIPGKSAEIQVRIERSPKYSEAVNLEMQFKYFTSILGDQLPPGVTMSPKSQARLTGNTLTGKIILEATDKALPVERLTIGVLARVSINFSITTNYSSNPLYLTIPRRTDLAAGGE